MTIDNKPVFSDIQGIAPSAIIELFTLTFNHALHYNLWENNRTYELGDIVSSANSSKTIVFKCTTAGQSGNNEPSGFTSASNGSTISDNQVTWTAQNIDIYRFHAGTNLKEDIVNPEDADIIWNSQTYQRIPVTAEGFAYQKGQLPRPKLVVSNIEGTISAILLIVNKVTSGNDLMGATVTRIRTLARFLDAANFAPIGSNPPTNPFGTPDPDAEFPREIYTIDRKASENRDVVEFELAAAFDLVGVRAPKRQCTRSLFPSLGSFV